MIRTEVIIVGAGPVGLSAALELAPQGIHTIVLDSDPVPPVALAGGPQEAILQRLEARSAQASRPYALYNGPIGLRCGQAESVLRATADRELPDGDGQLLRAALLAALQPFAHVQVLWDHQVRELGQRDSEARVLVQTDEGDLVVEGDYIIGADGVHSTVRRTLGMRWEALGEADSEGQRVLQFGVKAAWNGAGCAPLHLMADPDDWAIVAQGTGTDEWQIVCAALDTQGSASSRAGQRLQVLFPDFADGVAVTNANTQLAHHRMAERFRAGKIFLAGDAAYEVPLYSGLGLGKGVDDARSLARAIGDVLRQGADDVVLDEWSVQRMAAARNTVAPQAEQCQALLMSADFDAERWRALLLAAG